MSTVPSQLYKRDLLVNTTCCTKNCSLWLNVWKEKKVWKSWFNVCWFTGPLKENLGKKTAHCMFQSASGAGSVHICTLMFFWNWAAYRNVFSLRELLNGVHSFCHSGAVGPVFKRLLLSTLGENWFNVSFFPLHFSAGTVHVCTHLVRDTSVTVIFLDLAHVSGVTWKLLQRRCYRRTGAVASIQLPCVWPPLTSGRTVLAQLRLWMSFVHKHHRMSSGNSPFSLSLHKSR